MPLIERYFAGKTAAISGAGDGIGRALTQRLNAAGCHLWLSDINESVAYATVDRDRRLSPSFRWLALVAADKAFLPGIARRGVELAE